MELSLDLSLRPARMMSAGRVTVTFTSPSGHHITLTAKARAPIDGRWQNCPAAEAVLIFVEVPGHGFGDRVGKLTARGFKPDVNADPARVWCAKQLFRYLAGEALPQGLVAVEENHCGRCGRELTDPVSIERGIGPECYGQMTGSRHQRKRAAQTSLPTEAAPDAAREHSVQEHLTGVDGVFYIYVGAALVAMRYNSRTAMEVARTHYNGHNRVTVMDNRTGQLVVQYDA